MRATADTTDTYEKMTIKTISSQQAVHLTHPKYRPDIDGLRAIAVLSVVIFHAFPKWLNGGFVGVDIFFVISGFLISTIIIGSLERDSFSFMTFYGRRIKRIFPALLLVLVFSLMFGSVVLFDDEFKLLGKHIGGGAVFASNYLLWQESGYFDNAAATKPLLHLWSLAVEEQFYIFWPLLLWVAYKKRLNFFAITIVVASISFALNIGGMHSDPVATFYSPQTRFWELMVGSVLAYVMQRKVNVGGFLVHAFSGWYTAPIMRNLQSIFGTLLIVFSLFVTKESNFPGWWAILPTLGALLIISAGEEAWFNRVVLSSRILVWFGLISFPLYLWHWPLLSFARIIESQTPPFDVTIVVLLISIIFAWLTYRFIEMPIRYGEFGKFKITALVILMSIMGFLGYECNQGHGVLRMPEGAASEEYRRNGADGGDKGYSTFGCGVADMAEQKLFPHCIHDSRQNPKYALLGDSKAEAIYGGLFRTSNENGRWLFIGNTVPIISEDKIYKRYQQFTKVAIKAIAENNDIEKVVLVTAIRQIFHLSSTSSIEDLPDNKNLMKAFNGLKHTINILVDAGKDVVIVVDNPTLPDPKDCTGRESYIPIFKEVFTRKVNNLCYLKLSRHLELSKQYRMLLTMVEREFPGKVRVFDTTKYMCDVEKGGCSPYKNGRALYSYTDHISDYAAGLIGVDLNEFLRSD